uniref:OTU domain-containing protein n=1 Tax=Amphimedon queenslandica TaxID=400682 RepID=A0A1X7UX18_AMPQE
MPFLQIVAVESIHLLELLMNHKQKIKKICHHQRPKLGSPTTELTVPKGSTNIPGDGNCLFNALSHAITGSYIQQNFIRLAIIRHMPTMENWLRSWLTPYNSVKEYIAGEGMDKNYTWAGDIEMLTMADLLNVYICIGHNLK